MESVISPLLWVIVGLIIGMLCSSLWWRRQLWKLELAWRMNFGNYVNQAIAQYFGATVKDGIIYIPQPTTVDDETEVSADDKDKPN